MKKSTFITLAVIGVLAFLGITLFFMGVSYSNQEIQLRNQINAKILDNKNEYDNMWKKISQVAQVTERDRKSLMDIFVQYAKSRSVQSDQLVMTWIKETVPNVSSVGYQNLQNIIVSSRDSWTMRQKELIDYKREHDNLRQMFPSSMFVGGRPEIQITIVTSSKTQKVFDNGKDDDVNVFGKE